MNRNAGKGRSPCMNCSLNYETGYDRIRWNRKGPVEGKLGTTVPKLKKERPNG